LLNLIEIGIEFYDFSKYIDNIDFINNNFININNNNIDNYNDYSNNKFVFLFHCLFERERSILRLGNVTTGASLSSWYGELSIYLRCSGTIKDALLQITVVKTSGLSSAGQYETYGGSVFTQSITSNSTYVTYQWKMNSGKILICTGSSVQFAAQISLSGLAHSKSNDTYHVETMDSYNNTNIIDGYF